MKRPLIQMVSDVIHTPELDHCPCLDAMLFWCTPEVARLEARVVRLAELLGKAHESFTRRRALFRWDAIIPGRRIGMLEREILAAVNKLREARRAT